MHRNLLARVVVGAVFLSSSLTANAIVLTMDRTDACGVSVCEDYDVIDQDYGDASGVDLTWGTATNTMAYWSDDYSDVTDVVFAESDENSVGQIEIAAVSGSTITLNGFDLAAYDIDTDSAWQIVDLDGTVLAAAAAIVVDSVSRTSIVAGFSSMNGFRIQWGPDGYNVGLDNLDFDVATSSVPETGTLSLLGLGLLSLSLARRKRAA